MNEPLEPKKHGSIPEYHQMYCSGGDDERIECEKADLLSRASALGMVLEESTTAIGALNGKVARLEADLVGAHYTQKGMTQDNLALSAQVGELEAHLCQAKGELQAAQEHVEYANCIRLGAQEEADGYAARCKELTEENRRLREAIEILRSMPFPVEYRTRVQRFVDEALQA